MKNRKLTTGSLAVALLIGLSGSALVYSAGGQHNNVARATQYSGSPDAQQQGYEHAYRDGADLGRQDRDAGAGYTLRDKDYLDGARGYQRVFGDKNQYLTGYREGYKAGYDDGYNDRAGRYGQVYGRPTGGTRAPARGDVYSNRSGGSTDMAFDAGYRGGITSGQQDRERNVRSNYRATDVYQRADSGYRASYGDKNQYRLQFQDGFERGYQDGYGRSRYSSDGGGYFPMAGPTGAVDTRDGHGPPNRSVSVPGNRQWTMTNIRVNQGDPFQVQTTGEIRMSANADDRAMPAGSVALKYIPASPMPNALGGALIGRIDNGRPFGIGNLTSLVMPASGILYLGVNEDNVGDNAGEFTVTLSW